MASGLRACESHNLVASALVILCIWPFVSHGKARSCYSPLVGQYSGTGTQKSNQYG